MAHRPNPILLQSISSALVHSQLCSQSAATENAAAAPHGHVQAVAAAKAKAKFMARVLRQDSNSWQPPLHDELHKMASVCIDGFLFSLTFFNRVDLLWHSVTVPCKWCIWPWEGGYQMSKTWPWRMSFKDFQCFSLCVSVLWNFICLAIAAQPTPKSGACSSLLIARGQISIVVKSSQNPPSVFGNQCEVSRVS